MNKELLISIISEDNNLSKDEKSELIMVLNNDVGNFSQKHLEKLLILLKGNSDKFDFSSMPLPITPGFISDPSDDIIR
ncbi:MAG: hypothetical protein J6J76_02655 [Paraprevotella sp.]|nr:hypothetical protein [Paraprevotella sp.]